jgi:hypothetical protein
MLLHLLNEKNLALLSIVLFGSIMAYVALMTNGTADDGDGIQHYLYAQYAFVHPANFLNHWAKPLFVMLSAPFAQFGFPFFKIYNTALLCAAMWLTFLTARQLVVKNAWLPVLFVAVSPMCSTHVQTGLTEPMFALFLIGGVYLFALKKDLWAVLLLSFLPFVRSEGLVILCVTGVYLLLIRQWKLLPLLLAGHVVMGLIGMSHYGSPLWVFNKIPYANLKNDIYGKGPWLHYYRNMPEVTGRWLYWYLHIGLLAGLGRLAAYWYAPQRFPFGKAELWLVYGMSVAYSVAHAMFWALGIFNSFGLLRVFIGILPLFAIIMAQGINLLLEQSDKLSSRWPSIALISLAALVPVWHVNKVLHWGTFNAYGDMAEQLDAGKQFGERYRGYTHYFDAIVPALSFPVDFFDPTQRRPTRQLLDGSPIPEKSVVIWDFRYSGWEAQVSLDTLLNSGRFALIHAYESEFNGKIIRKTCILEYLPPKITAVPPGEVFFDNMEKLPPNNQTDRTYQVSGKKSLRLDRKQVFSPGLEDTLSAFYAGAASRLRCTLQARINAFPKDEWTVARLVVEVNQGDQNRIWWASSLQPAMTATGQWQPLTIDYILPKPETPGERIKVYIWNDNDEPIWIDDFKIELLQ